MYRTLSQVQLITFSQYTIVYTEYLYATMNSSNKSNITFTDEAFSLPTVIRILAAIVVIENAFAIFILIRSLQLPNNIRSLSICLACTDFSAGLLALIPLSILNSAVFCKIHLILATAVLMASFLNISAISMDMSASLMCPFRYGRLATALFYKMVCLSLWFLGLLFGTITFYGRNLNDTCSIPFNKSIGIQTQTYTLFAFVIWNIILYAYIFIVIRKKNRNVLNGTTGRRQIRQTLKLTAVVLTFIVCFLPHALLNVLLLTLEGEIYQQMLRIRKIGFAVVFLNSLLNPILFVFRFRVCRYHAFTLLCSCFNKNRMQICKPIPSVDLNLQELSNQRGTNQREHVAWFYS